MSYVPLSGAASNFGRLTYIVSAVTHRTRGPRKYHDEELDMAQTGSMDPITAGNLADGAKILAGLAGIITGIAAIATFAGAIGNAGSTAAPKA